MKKNEQPNAEDASTGRRVLRTTVKVDLKAGDAERADKREDGYGHVYENTMD